MKLYVFCFRPKKKQKKKNYNQNFNVKFKLLVGLLYLFVEPDL